VLTAHAGLAERLVEKDQAPRIYRRNESGECLPADDVLRRVALDGDEGLFFRVNPKRASARPTDEALVWIPLRRSSSAAISAIVRSGRFFTSVRS
jgi:hypothetical protein